jgi:tetratricopeptide (TPR) repeat protein
MLNDKVLVKVGRNTQCNCGSGKKYKKCCLNKVSSIAKETLNLPVSIDKILQEASAKILEYDRLLVEAGIKSIKEVLERKGLSIEHHNEANLSLCKGYQHLGLHEKALDILKTIECEDPESDPMVFWVELYAAQSFSALGYLDSACEIFDNLLLNNLEGIPAKDEKDRRRVRGMYLLEAGKAFNRNSQKDIALTCWTESLSLLEEFKDLEVEHYQRAKSNLAFVKLTDDDKSIQEQGVDEAEASIIDKLSIGDIQGTANSFCNLGSYFQRIKRFGRAISYFRKDLYLSEITGNKRDIAATLGNLSVLYIEVKQFKKAKYLIWKAKQLSIELNDESLRELCDRQSGLLSEEAKKFALAKTPINEKAICSCDSGILFVDCCGRADFEPVKMPQILGGISEDKKEIEKELSNIGIKTSPMDFIIRNTPSSKARRAWSKHEVKDGWLELSELPDMANLHFNSAKDMAALSNESKSLSHALSAIILSVCGLEAFINQISFFLFEHQEDDAIDIAKLPTKLISEGALSYQRTTSLEVKWQELSNGIICSEYLKKNRFWAEIKDLIYIRNELVHFKSSGYEQIVPVPRIKSTIYNRIPKSVELTNELHSWPFKVLNESLAIWATELTDQFVSEFKIDFQEIRKKKELH